ncbi:MAG: thioredoxin family protein [Polyangiaceae bacterium]|nr:thioredoxin family protein [Polyangiaceae bacterium]
MSYRSLQVGLFLFAAAVSAVLIGRSLEQPNAVAEPAHVAEVASVAVPEEPVGCEAPESGACNAPEPSDAMTLAQAPTGVPRLLEFTSQYCPACAKMAPLLTEIEHTCNVEPGTVVRLDIEQPQGEALMAHYGIRLLPTFLTVNAKGEEVSRLVGDQPRERLALALGEVRGSACPAL